MCKDTTESSACCTWGAAGRLYCGLTGYVGGKCDTVAWDREILIDCGHHVKESRF